MITIVDIPYLADRSPKQTLDLYLTDRARDPMSAILWIHGEVGNAVTKIPARCVTLRSGAMSSPASVID